MSQLLRATFWMASFFAVLARAQSPAGEASPNPDRCQILVNRLGGEGEVLKLRAQARRDALHLREGFERGFVDWSRLRDGAERAAELFNEWNRDTGLRAQYYASPLGPEYPAWLHKAVVPRIYFSFQKSQALVEPPTQFGRALKELFLANRNLAVIFDPAEMGCWVSSGMFRCAKDAQSNSLLYVGFEDLYAVDEPTATMEHETVHLRAYTSLLDPETFATKPLHLAQARIQTNIRTPGFRALTMVTRGFAFLNEIPAYDVSIVRDLAHLRRLLNAPEVSTRDIQEMLARLLRTVHEGAANLHDIDLTLNIVKHHLRNDVESLRVSFNRHSKPHPYFELRFPFADTNPSPSLDIPVSFAGDEVISAELRELDRQGTAPGEWLSRELRRYIDVEIGSLIDADAAARSRIQAAERHFAPHFNVGHEYSAEEIRRIVENLP